jgi:eukaryotic-like serine/threonine-protein kinase
MGLDRLAAASLWDRIRYSVHATGYAFDPERAAHAIDCLALGLDAMHEIGVINRDIKPASVLWCGFGEDEIFKLADFGLARPAETHATFGGTCVGTPGFVGSISAQTLTTLA